MKLTNDIYLQVEIFEENGNVKVFIVEEDSTGVTTSNIKDIKDISKALEDYLTEIL